MNVKTYNSEVYPKISHARSFLHCLDHATQKAGPEAEMQLRVIGWNDELKAFLKEAVDHYADHLRSQVE